MIKIMQDIYDYLDELQNDIFNLEPKNIELKYFEICKQLAGSKVAEDIYQISMKDYEKGLEDSFKEVVQYVNNNDVKAIYFEYDIDNNWDSEYYLCEDYYELSEGDDDWACDWEHNINGPGFNKFTQVYEEKGGFGNRNDLIGVTLFLIARTIVSFLNVVKDYTTSIPICIAYHDQDPIMRTKKD